MSYQNTIDEMKAQPSEDLHGPQIICVYNDGPAILAKSVKFDDNAQKIYDQELQKADKHDFNTDKTVDADHSCAITNL